MASLWSSWQIFLKKILLENLMSPEYFLMLLKWKASVQSACRHWDKLSRKNVCIIVWKMRGHGRWLFFLQVGRLSHCILIFAKFFDVRVPLHIQGYETSIWMICHLFFLSKLWNIVKQWIFVLLQCLILCLCYFVSF